MVGQRNRIIKIKEYLASIGIEINIGKNKARGNKGIFWNKKTKYRIDISKNLSEENILPTVIHEFAHYLHSTYDTKLKDLNFAFNNYSPEIQEELIALTVHTVPKEYAVSLFKIKDEINNKIKYYSDTIKKEYPNFKKSVSDKKIESHFSGPLRYLLKYNIINYYNKIYSLKNLEKDFSNLNTAETAYLRLKSEQRNLKRINSRINRINRYFNSPTELFARFLELYYTETDTVIKIAPISKKMFEESELFKSNKQFTEFNQILSNSNFYANIPK